VDGGTIQSEPPLEMSELMKKTNGILDSSQEALKNVTLATASLSSIGAKIDEGHGTVGALLNDKAIYNQLEQTTSGLHDTVTKAQAGVTDFQENMEALKKNFLLRGFYKNRGYEDSSDLAKNEIPHLPQAEPLKTFTYEPQLLFDKVDTAKPKNQKSLRAAGQFLADNEFGVAVVVVSTGMAGDTEKDLVLTQARASVVRDYLVDNFGFDDAELKTFGTGKKNGTNRDAGWGALEIIIYPPGTDVPVK
jgi:outer membrane protein OmpA-like peptidoglycan-associated protein